MPSDAKSSPWFHEVSPEIVSPHSFCQTLLPIFKASLCQSVMAVTVFGQSAISPVATTANGKPAPPNRWQSCFLDGRHLSISVRLSAATNLKLNDAETRSYETFYCYRQRIRTCIPVVWAREIIPAQRPKGQGQLQYRNANWL